AINKVGDRRELAAELAAVSWEDKHVILTPPSTISTNKKEVWTEFFLARLLREQGAEVKSLHLPPLNGRKQTWLPANGTGVLVEPPFYGWEAAAQAEDASERARHLDAERKALPRKKGSPKFEKAIRFLQKNKVSCLTKEIITKGTQKGLSETTLKRAFKTS